MASATAQVLNTYELIQLIVELLPPRKVCVVQAVCKTWQGVTQSKKIQQTLFKAQVSPPIAPRLTDTTSKDLWVEDEQQLVLNRILPGLTPIIKWDRINGLINLDYTFHVPKSFFSTNKRGCNSPDGRPASYIQSYLEMFVTQPPAAVVNMRISAFGSEETSICSVRESCGLKFWHLFEVLEKVASGLDIEDDTATLKAILYFSMPVDEQTRDEWAAERNELMRTMQGTWHSVIMLEREDHRIKWQMQGAKKRTEESRGLADTMFGQRLELYMRDLAKASAKVHLELVKASKEWWLTT